jgi:hypothetical protein
MVVPLYPDITKHKWPSSYGSWIYNYLWNQCISPLMLWVRISIRVRCTRSCDKFCQYFIVLALTRTEFELTIYCIRDKMLTTTPPILFYAEMRIAILSSRDRMAIRFTTTYAISAYHHWCCEFESRSGWDAQDHVINFVNDLRHRYCFMQKWE